MSQRELRVSRATAIAMAGILVLGILIGLGMLIGDLQFGIFPLKAAVTGLGVVVASLALVQTTLLMGLHQRSLGPDEAAETSPYRTLLIVLGIGILLAAGFAASGTELGVVPLESAVAGLGVAVLTLSITTIGIVWFMRQESIQTVVPGEPGPEPSPRALGAANSTMEPQAAAEAAGAEEPLTPETASAPVATASVAATIQLDPAEETQHVLSIEGIGEKYASRLNAHGIISIPQLRRADPQDIAAITNTTVTVVQEWQSMAELLQLKGIGPQSAEVLVRAGIHSISQLAQTDPDGLVSAIEAAQAGRKIRIQGNDIKAGTTRRWVAAARDAEHQR